MKTNKTIRSIVAMMVIFFAAATTSCKKESEITPTTPQTPTAPVIPVTPVTPAVSTRPTFILTTENGSAVRKQVYQYDAQGKLKKYESLTSGNTSDSVSVSTNRLGFFRHGSANVSQVLVLNTDKTYKSLFFSSSQVDFENNQNKLSRILQTRTDGSVSAVAGFSYTGNSLNSMSAEITISINYYNNIPYQTGINEIPVAVKPLKYYKLLEQENATSTILYDKLIRQVILQLSASRIETHDFAYTFDSNNRVTQITDTVKLSNGNASAQKVFVSTITY